MRYLFAFIFILSCTSSVPSSHLEDITAEQLLTEIEARKGKKAVLVNFWATWCAPCVEEFPHILELQKAYKNDLDVLFVSFDFKKNRKLAQRFLSDQEVTFTSYFKAQSDMNFMKHMPEKWTGAIPYTMLFSKDGSRIAELEGKRTKAQFESYIKQAIK